MNKAPAHRYIVKWPFRTGHGVALPEKGAF